MLNQTKRILSLISAPAWRLGTLFLWWGTFHLGWMVFMLWTNVEQARFRLVVLFGLRLVAGMLLLVTHLKGVAFRPVHIGMERLWRCLILRRIDEFFQLELQSLDTPLEDMPALEARFDRWLDSIPWNYNLEAPNTKCMDGVGVHINRYFDLYGMQFWQATCREASVGVALRQYRLQHGEWPADLEKLVPSFLPKLPCDPFINGPLKVASHPEYPNALTVYSARKIGDDARPDELLQRGFPVAEK